MNFMTRVLMSLAVSLVWPNSLVLAQQCDPDTIPPVLQCFGSSINLQLTEARPRYGISARDLVRSVEDNCTSEKQITLSFTPEEVNPSMFISCDLLGLNPYTIYATDSSGNQTTCPVSLRVIDQGFICAASDGFEITGEIRSPSVNLTSAPEFILRLKDSSGVIDTIEPLEVLFSNNQFAINLFKEENPFPPDAVILLEVKVDVQEDYSIGVSTLDVVFIIKHILGIAPFKSPKQIIAADVNTDGQVTTLDVIEVRKLIIELIDAFSSGTSHAVFPAQYEIQVSELHNSAEQVFEVIKLGDVNRF